LAIDPARAGGGNGVGLDANNTSSWLGYGEA